MAWKRVSQCRQGLRRADRGGSAAGVQHVLLNKYYVDEGYDYVFTGRRKVGGVRLGVMGLGEAVPGSIRTSSTAR